MSLTLHEWRTAADATAPHLREVRPGKRRARPCDARRPDAKTLAKRYERLTEQLAAALAGDDG